MQVLLIRHDADNTVHWKVYGQFDGMKLLTDLQAHLNTSGVVKLEIFPEG